MENRELELCAGTISIRDIGANRRELTTKRLHLPSVTNESRNNLQLQRLIAIASSVLLIAKFIAYYLTDSVAVLTDALESIVNVIAGFIGLYSLYVAAKPRDIDHPYGHGKAEFVSAAVEGTLVLSAGLVIIYITD